MIARKFKIFLSLFSLSILLFGSSKCFAKIPENPVKFFDSTNCKGYEYFINRGILFDSTSNINLYNEIYGWIGVPYRRGGKTKAGADCSGFASQIYNLVYSIKVSGSAGDIYKALKPIDKSELKEGDLIFFKINRYYISHVGIYLSNNKFIHATSYGKSVTINDLNSPYYKRYYFSAGRYVKE